MKKPMILGLSILLFQPLYAASILKTEQQKLSYIMGLSAGESLKNKQVKIDEALFAKGLHDGLTGAEPLMPKEKVKAFLLDLHQKQEKKMANEQLNIAKENEEKGASFLAQNAKKEGVVTLPSGLQYKVMKEGEGQSPKADSTVTVNYEGTLLDGTVFDSSYKRGEPISFPVSAVIPGWTEALKLMKPGATWMLYIPAKLAYGSHGAPGAIPPGATLIFKVELISFK